MKVTISDAVAEMRKVGLFKQIYGNISILIKELSDHLSSIEDGMERAGAYTSRDVFNVQFSEQISERIGRAGVDMLTPNHKQTLYNISGYAHSLSLMLSTLIPQLSNIEKLLCKLKDLSDNLPE